MGSLNLADASLEGLFGIHDQNLKHIGGALGVAISARGSDVRIEGEPAQVALAESLLSQLSALAVDGTRVQAEHIRTATRVLKQDPNTDLKEFFAPKDELLAAVRRLVSPRSLNQHVYLQAMLQDDIVISIGPAGTGKTFLAVAMAASALLEKKVRRIVLARPAVEAGEKLGFLPGDLAEKVNPYLRPLHDSLFDLLGYERTNRLIEKGIIEVAPIAFMRGRTLNESFVILDEAQNTTPEQMKMFLTRIGFGSKAVVNGDVTQIDLPPGRESGLRQAEVVLAKVKGIRFIHFDRRDVVRHPLVQKIVAAYDRFSQGEPSRDRPD